MTPAPKISVCMATFNGERHVAAQIASILPQLRPQDELMIVDDASTDNTVERIQAVNDFRIHLTVRETNQGVVATFEEAIRKASGRIIFLSDMDDTWAPDKVARFMDAFQTSGYVGLVHSAINLIDEQGKPLTWSSDNQTNFRAGFFTNVWKNHFQGSALAFDASLLTRILPFPRGRLFYHDVWIGTRAALVHHPIVYIKEPLINYRIHASNHSGKLQPSRQVLLRVQLLYEHFKRMFRRS